MNVLDCMGFTFTYAGTNTPVLQDLSFSVAPGEMILLCGPSGCGKTTLLRMMKKELQPAGRQAGEIRYKGISIKKLPDIRAASEIGMVFQHPEHQIVMEEVLQELVFGMENVGFPPDQMRRRLAETISSLGLEMLLTRRTESLSGGQKQLLNLASIMALRPRLLLLDEPTGFLDPIGAVQFLQTIKRLNEETGITVIFTEHRLEEAYPLADRVLVMDGGSLLYDGSPRDGIEWMNRAGSRHRHLVPTIPRLALQTGVKSDFLPLTVKEGRQWLKEHGKTASAPTDPPEETVSVPPNPILSLNRIDFRYDPETEVLKQTTFQVSPGECLAIFGANGSGKSTVLQMMANSLQPDSGSIRYKGKKRKKRKDNQWHHQIGYLPQNPEAFFLRETVEAELDAVASRFSKEEKRDRCQEVITHFKLLSLLTRHPHDLSGGEMQKVALACLLLRDPEVLLLDEPTKGMDPELKRFLSQEIQAFIQKGRTVVMTTHDVEFAAVTATRCTLLFDGDVLTPAPASSFFRKNDFFTTAVYRVTRDTGMPEAVTVEEAVRLWQSPDWLSVSS
ncbi:ABC transporter ATP-binding protein [Melghirimyces algeriensis]|uniref:Energy-coupling factor transport system ATP-binding protein n=1 Tax=Melghirimyces algeriensis TaxID=910412 RepID=A0A521FHM4_9BACL|nr:ATP-binding cassette domain-containing protein [Melghirimyces algeriensis]SMO95161.1 energy-coupling factor transport system ATP-binding protein [Melghirimyces algeriensis]